MTSKALVPVVRHLPRVAADSPWRSPWGLVAVRALAMGVTFLLAAAGTQVTGPMAAIDLAAMAFSVAVGAAWMAQRRTRSEEKL